MKLDESTARTAHRATLIWLPISIVVSFAMLNLMTRCAHWAVGGGIPIPPHQYLPVLWPSATVVVGGASTAIIGSRVGSRRTVVKGVLTAGVGVLLLLFWLFLVALVPLT